MMNEERDQFEECLRRQPLKEVPAEWRAEILAAAAAANRPLPAVRPTLVSTLKSQLSTLLWPHPVAWAGLAAVWLFILAADFSTRDSSPVHAEKSGPATPAVMVELRQQKRLLAELIGPRDACEADRSKSLAPRSRSEYIETAAV